MRAIAGGLLLKTGEYDASAERAAPQDTTTTRRGRRVQTWPIWPVFEVSVVFLIAISAAFWGTQGACQCWLCRFRVPLSRAAFACRRCDIPAWNASGATHLGESQPLDVPGDEGGQEEQ